MYDIRFVFWEGMKALSLAFLGLLAVKSIGNLAGQRKLGTARITLYAVVLGLVGLGARIIGDDTASELYRWAAEDNLKQGDYSKAYENGLRAVNLRPGQITNWRTLASAKLYQDQFESVLADLSAFQSLSGGDLDESEAYRFALCHFYLGEYDKVISSTERLIERNRSYAAPYVLQGNAYTILGKHAEAEGSFLAILQQFPNNQPAVEGLAHEYFLEGQRARALAVLTETTKYSFPSEARTRFEALKQLYAQ